MKKIILITIVSIILIFSFIGIKYIKKETNQIKTYNIGILQTASHPALDATRDGFIEELKNKLNNDIEFTILNAEGSISQAHAIAQQFHATKKYNGFFAIATLAAQALSCVEKSKPIFISAVTDPNSLGLMHSKTNVCGTKDMIDVKAEIEMLMQLLPNTKTIGLLYTAGEANSLALIKQMQSEIESRGLHYIDFAVINETDMQVTAELACRKVDVILAPTDNSVASTISLISTITLKNKIPLIVSDNMLVQYGPLAAQGIDYKASGKQTAQIAYKVLTEGIKPYELPIEQAKSDQIFINKKTLDTFGLIIPSTLEKNVILV